MTLENDRRIKTSRGDYVRNGSRWFVTGVARMARSTLSRATTGERRRSPRSTSGNMLRSGTPSRSTRRRDRRPSARHLLVDEQMSAAQLYVGMSRGREENRAFVICSDDDPDDHVRRPRRRRARRVRECDPPRRCQPVRARRHPPELRSFRRPEFAGRSPRRGEMARRPRGRARPECRDRGSCAAGEPRRPRVRLSAMRSCRPFGPTTRHGLPSRV